MHIIFIRCFFFVSLNELTDHQLFSVYQFKFAAIFSDLVADLNWLKPTIVSLSHASFDSLFSGLSDSIPE